MVHDALQISRNGRTLAIGWIQNPPEHTGNRPTNGLIARDKSLTIVQLKSWNTKERHRRVPMDGGRRFKVRSGYPDFRVVLQRHKGSDIRVVKSLPWGAASKVAELLNIHFDLDVAHRQAKNESFLEFPTIDTATAPLPEPVEEAPRPQVHDDRPLIIPTDSRAPEHDYPQ